MNLPFDVGRFLEDAKTCALLAGASLGAVYAIIYAQRTRRKRRLKQLRKDYQSVLYQRLNSLEIECDKVNDEFAKSITNLPFEELTDKLRNGQLTCTQVLQAFQKIAVQENKLYNFITEPILEAKDIAQRLDALNAEDKMKLPLFGVPVSIKENYVIKGYLSTGGRSLAIEHHSNEHCALYQSLVDAGAVPFIRTNLPQTMMSFGAHNPIYGQTKNPLNPLRSPGGSSSGEGAAVCSGASLLGIGTDIGGSVRVPAAWCGVFGFKPSSGRLSVCGLTSIHQGQKAIRATAGVVTRSLDICISFLRAMTSDIQYDIDLTLPPLRFNEEELNSTRPLTVAYLTKVSQTLPVTESAQNIVKSTVAELAKLGHKIIKWEIPKVKNLDPAELLLISIFGDGGESFKEALDGDEISYVIKPTMDMLRIPRWLKRVLGKVLGIFMPSWWVFKYLTAPSGLHSIKDLYAHHANIDRYRKAWLDDWKNKGIDVLITPAVPIPAELIDTVHGCCSGTGAYTFIYNLIDFPAGVIPIRKITYEEEQFDLEMFPEENFMQRKQKESVLGSNGLPLSLQVVALPYKEELCLRVMKVIDSIAKDSNNKL